MVKTVLRIVGLTLLFSYLIVAGFIYGSWRPEPRFRDIKIVIDYPSDEAHFVTEQGILQLVKTKPGFKYKGEKYKDVNTLELAQYIERHNQLVRRVSCFHTPDSLLRIDIEQRNPILRIKSQSGVKSPNGNTMSDFYIDREGEMMPAQTGTAVHLPLVTGNVRDKDIAPLLEFARFLKSDRFWDDEITQIYIRENGDVELVPRIGDHTILLGSLDNFKKKLKHVNTFYSEVLSTKGWNSYRTINVKFEGQVIGEK